MPTATWNGQVIAKTDRFEEVDGKIYFPAACLRREFFEPSEKRTVCGWKGEATYYTVVVDGKRNEDAAWTYPDPKQAAENLRDHVAFWKGIEVSR